MRQLFTIISLTIFLILGLAPTGQVRAALPVAVDGQALPSLAPVLERVTPSVVNVYTQTRVRIRSPLLEDPFFRRFFNVPETPRERVSQSLGSGVIVDAKMGYVLTNNHVIAGATEISVTLTDGRSLQAEVIGSDPDTDLAMIRIPAENLQALPLADSNQLRVGDFVVAVGNPFGLGQTVTSGIVSALGRTGFRGLEFQNFIQTDASINPGNSGGALINLRGELVGINSAIFTPSGGNVGIGFAIPSAMASYVMSQLTEFGEVRRGTLGIYVQDLTAELAGAFGVDSGKGALVADVTEGSAGAAAGIQAGDVITRLGGYAINNAQDLHNVEGQLPLGEQRVIEFVRQRDTMQADISTQALQELDGGMLDRRLSGVKFTELPLRLRSERISGVLVAELESDSRMARGGLRQGDVVNGINRQRIANLADLQRTLGGSSGSIYLQILRNGNTYTARID